MPRRIDHDAEPAAAPIDPPPGANGTNAPAPSSAPPAPAPASSLASAASPAAAAPPPAADQPDDNGHLPDDSGHLATINGETTEAATAALAMVPTTAAGTAAPAGQAVDPGLYGVLGLAPTASGAEILTAYRRQAARLLDGDAGDIAALRRLNGAYEVLGNTLRREEYDRLRQAPSGGAAPGGSALPVPGRTGARSKAAAPLKRRRRPRHVVQPRYPGLVDVLVVLLVVGLSVGAGALIIPRLSINLSALNALQVILPLANSSQRRAADATATAAPTSPAPTATVSASLAQRFNGSTVSVSNPTPARNSSESIQVKLRRDGKPAANVEVWSIVQYRTTQERWPPDGTVKTDASGAATITFDIGSATPAYPVQVRVLAQVDDQTLSWSTTFTPQ